MRKYIELFGVNFLISNVEQLLEIIRMENKVPPKYICFPDTYVITKSVSDVNLRSILNNSFLTIPDGKPIQIYGHIKGNKEIRTISGYHLLKKLLLTKLTHYFYGSDSDTLQKLKRNIETNYPNAKILGYKSAPIIDLGHVKDNPDISKDFREIKRKKPELIWIGLSSPKQDYLMHFFHKSIKSGIMIGVGAVFDYMAKTKKISPEWMKRLAIRWIYRFFLEPRRLWRKYFIYNWIFLYYLFMDLLGFPILKYNKNDKNFDNYKMRY